jgi:riboflavin synthase
MFTGLVEDIGEIVGVAPRGRGRALWIRTRIPMAETALGDSIAVDGACLTVDEKGADRFLAIAGQETLAKTTLADATVGRTVHLERALRLGDRLGGHLVQGHIDGVGVVRKSQIADETWILWIEAPAAIGHYLCNKGSVSIDGVSLTINEITHDANPQFRLNIVPHTASVTRLGRLRPGDRVNLEADVIAKYVERLIGARRDGSPAGASAPGLTEDTLKKYGFFS